MPTQQFTAAADHLKSSEVNKIILATNSFWDRCLIKTLYWTGLRRSEVQNLAPRILILTAKELRRQAKEIRPG